MYYRTILAKSPKDPDNPAFEETLAGHTEAVCRVSSIICKRLSEFLRSQIGCNSKTIDAWSQAVWISAWIHDWGKCSEDFQAMIRGSNNKQAIRHETLSMAILNELIEWLDTAFYKLPSWANASIRFAVAGHHLKYPDPFENERVGSQIQVFLSHPDFFQVLDIGAKHYDLMPPPKLKDLRIKRRDVNNLDYLFKNYHLDDYNLVEKVLIASVKSCLMASDLSGSALPRVGVDPEEWLQERLFRALSKENLLKVVDNRLRGQSPLQFQQEARDSDSNTIILEAGCGSGKTAAAYYWASSHADGKRLFFCYPTTGTASEGFSGYLSHRDDFDATLIHSRARIDYRLLSNMPNHSHEENELRLSGLEALETWPIPAVVCTAHTVLGLLENVRRGLYAWPSLVQSVFVFDEIHSFSERLFDYLLVFLRIFVNTPVLLMTATLPQKSRELLEKACADRGEIQIIRGPADRENSPRYEFSSLDREDAINEAKRTLSNSGKVLWVSNTVARTMEIVKEALDINLPVQPYHSRYRYRDRLTRQRKVIDGFKPDKPAMLAVTTQVAEMSLDISADLLITDLAPVPSLIQRLGRLNRYEANPAKTKKAIFLNPENLLPYASKDEERDLRRKIAEWLRLLSDRKALSQKDLFDTFQQTEDQQLSASCRKNHKCDWLDGLHISRKSSKAIEESGHTVEVVMEEDLENGDPVEFAIPMPIINSIRNINKFSGRFLVAPKGTIDYDEFRGAKWKK